MKWIGALGFVAVVTAVGAAQAGKTGCADETRRADAVRLARAINTAEAASFRGQRSYLQLGDLPVGAIPGDMTVQLSTDGETYTFSIKDATDVCHGAVFSDQQGVIYVGAPLQ